jgi:hypothetical protein
VLTVSGVTEWCMLPGAAGSRTWTSAAAGGRRQQHLGQATTSPSSEACRRSCQPSSHAALVVPGGGSLGEPVELPGSGGRHQERSHGRQPAGILVRGVVFQW